MPQTGGLPHLTPCPPPSSNPPKAPRAFRRKSQFLTWHVTCFMTDLSKLSPPTPRCPQGGACKHTHPWIPCTFQCLWTLARDRPSLCAALPFHVAFYLGKGDSVGKPWLKRYSPETMFLGSLLHPRPRQWKRCSFQDSLTPTVPSASICSHASHHFVL